MKVLVENIYLSLGVAQTVFMVLGFWAPDTLKGYKKNLFHVYTFVSYIFLNGSYIIVQFGYLCKVWGNVPLMTGAIFMLFTNLSLSVKIVNVYRKKKFIQEMIAEADTELSTERKAERVAVIQRNNRECKFQLYIYTGLSYGAVVGWAISADDGELPLQAWYPYDSTKSPAYELTYTHQILALTLAATLNICLDNLVTSLISQCQCRFHLLSMSLRNLCNGLTITQNGLVSPEDDALLTFRLHRLVKQHQAILRQAAQLQGFFSIPVLGQFGVSMVIICVTAYQMALVNESFIWFISMLEYLIVMLIQVFVYCYHGNKLVTESGKVAGAAYESPWYMCRPAQRRCLLLVMVRAQREARLMAGGLTELSLATFMAIVKASYTFFTVLQGVEDGPKK